MKKKTKQWDKLGGQKHNAHMLLEEKWNPSVSNSWCIFVSPGFLTQSVTLAWFTHSLQTPLLSSWFIHSLSHSFTQSLPHSLPCIRPVTPCICTNSDDHKANTSYQSNPEYFQKSFQDKYSIVLTHQKCSPLCFSLARLKSINIILGTLEYIIMPVRVMMPYWNASDATYCQGIGKKENKLSPPVPAASRLNPRLNLSHSLHLHLHFVTGRDLISEIDARSRLSPEFNRPLCFKERTPVLNLLCRECTSLLIHALHHPLCLISHHRHPPSLPPLWLPQASPSLIKA